MDINLVWSIEAIEDIESIATYISRDSPRYAAAVVKDLLDGMALVSAQPRIGRKVPELNLDSVRERIIHNYRAIYEIQTNRLLVLAVVHCRNNEKIQSVVDVSKNET